METQSKKIDETKAKDKKNGLQLVFQAVCFVLRFLLFFNPFFIFIASCGIIFLLNSSAWPLNLIFISEMPFNAIA